MATPTVTVRETEARDKLRLIFKSLDGDNSGKLSSKVIQAISAKDQQYLNSVAGVDYRKQCIRQFEKDYGPTR